MIRSLSPRRGRGSSGLSATWPQRPMSLRRNPFVEDIVFHAQQAVEKSLKAFLAWHGRAFRKTHSLEELGEQCLEIEPDLETIVARAVPLTDYAWKFRYPGEPEAPTREEAEGALATAREVFVTILARLPEDVRP